MSDGGSVDVVDDEDFFDQPLSGRDANRKAADESAHANANTSRDGGHRSGSDDERSSNRSSEGSRRSSDEEKSSRDRRISSASVKYHIVIPSVPTDSQQVDFQAGDSKTLEVGSAEPVQEQQPRRKTKKKKNKKVITEQLAETAGLENENHEKKSRSRNSTSSCSKSEYSSDEEKPHLQTSHPRRSASSISYSHRSQQSARNRKARATSAPAMRPQQSTPFRSSSRMDVKVLLDSLLHAENPRPRRQSAASPVEFRRKRDFTFSNQRLEMIERENKRLLQKIVMIHYSPQDYHRSVQKPVAPLKPLISPDVARMRQLEKIEKENSELLHRIQTAQPSHDICRAAQLADYKRNRAYLDRDCYYTVPRTKSSQRRRAKSESRPARFD